MVEGKQVKMRASELKIWRVQPVSPRKQNLYQRFQLTRYRSEGTSNDLMISAYAFHSSILATWQSENGAVSCRYLQFIVVVKQIFLNYYTFLGNAVYRE
jgi:hypothetical protein